MTAAYAQDGTPSASSVKSGNSKPSKTRAAKKTSRAHAASSSTASTVVSAVVHQDSTSLRSTAGDTGSVIWRSSVRLAACLTRQLHRSQRVDVPPILSKRALERGQPWTVLELGSGTGILPALLSSYLSQQGTESPGTRLRWHATDQEAMLPLLQRNLIGEHHGRGIHAMDVHVSALDWLVASRLLRQAARAAYTHGKDHFRAQVMGNSQRGPSEDTSAGHADYPDLLIAVDCVFNPALFAPLIDTLDLFTLPGHTVVFVLIELRSSDATLAFLETWLRQDEEDRDELNVRAAKSRWQIWNVPSEQLAQGGSGLDKGYAAWVAWKQ